MEKKKLAVAGVVVLLVVVAGMLAWMFRPRPGYFADLPALMESRYGRYDAKEKAWGIPETGRYQNGDRVFRICARQSVHSGATEKLLLAVCGSLPESPSHADAGLIDFFVLEKVGDELHLLVLSEDNESGSFGTPGEVAVVRLGRAFWGFRVDEVWTGQGYHLGASRIFAPGQQGMAEALAVRTLIDSRGSMACEDDANECTSLERKLVVDDSQPTAATWPLRITESGYRKNQNVYAVYEVGFDTASWMYDFPEQIGLQDE